MSQPKIINGKEIDEKDGMVLDFGQDDEIIPEHLPDADEILNNILLILEFMGTDEMMALRKENDEVFLSTMENKFEDFALKYYSVFRMVIGGSDLGLLIEMLDTIKKMKTGSISVERGEKHIGGKLKEFLPVGFEEKLQKETSRKMKKGKRKNCKK